MCYHCVVERKAAITVRAQALLLGTTALVLLLVGSASTGTIRAGALDVSVVSLTSLSVYLLPLIALLLSFDALVGEFERGTMLLLLTYPVARWQVVMGEFFGHMMILLAAVVVGYGGAAVITVLFTDNGIEGWQAYVNMMATTLLLGLLLADHEQRISQSLFSVLMLVNPADTYRLLNLTAFDTVGQVAGIAGVAARSGFGVTLLLCLMMMWVVVPLAATMAIFHRRELSVKMLFRTSIILLASMMSWACSDRQPATVLAPQELTRDASRGSGAVYQQGRCKAVHKTAWWRDICFRVHSTRKYI